MKEVKKSGLKRSADHFDHDVTNIKRSNQAKISPPAVPGDIAQVRFLSSP